MTINENLNVFILDLLHINDVNRNKLIDLKSGDLKKTFYLYHSLRESISKYVLKIISARLGKPGNTVLRKSAEDENGEQIIGKDVNDLEWRDGEGITDSLNLRRFIQSVYSELSLKGNNPLFLSVGALKWKVFVDKKATEITSPLILFPIRLIRPSVGSSPVYIEFINDEIYFNPCLMAKLRQVVGDSVVDNFPHPNGEKISVDEPIDFDKLLQNEDYLDIVKKYVDEQKRDDISAETTFEFDKEIVAIAQYNHDELCAYYDIKRNKEKIYNHPLVKRIFNKNQGLPVVAENNAKAHCILPRDSVQERIIRRVVNGESLIVKGPPGTGKTLTITNMIASLLAANKKVLLSSKKIAAMSEIYAKLPSQLRKFVMFLVSETESQAATLNPVEIKKELRSLIDKKKTYTFSNSALEEHQRGVENASDALQQLKKYTAETFDVKDVIGLSYYQALDLICKTDVEPVAFANPEEAICLTREEYVDLLSAVTNCAEYYAKICNNHLIKKSPWLPAYASFNGCNLEKAHDDYAVVSNLASNTLSTAKQVLASVCPEYENLPIFLAELLSSVKINQTQIQAVTDQDCAPLIQSIIDSLENYLIELKLGSKVKIASNEENSNLSVSLNASNIDRSLTIDEFNLLYDNSNALSKAKDPKVVDALSKIIATIRDLKEKLIEQKDRYYSIVRKDLDDAQLKEVDKATEYLIKYQDKDVNKPSFFDFKGKKLYSTIKVLGYGKEISFKDTISICVLKEQIAQTELAIEDMKVKVSSVFNVKFNEEQLKSVFLFARKCAEANFSETSYLVAFDKDKELVKKAVSLGNISGNVTLKEIIQAYKIVSKLQDLNEVTKRFTEKYPDFSTADSIEVAKTIKAICALERGKYLGSNCVDIALSCQKIYENGFALKKAILGLKEQLSAFAINHFPTFYTEEYENLIFSDMRILIEESLNRDILNAVINYLTIKKGNYSLSLERFFRPFEFGVRTLEGHTFEEIFERSVYSLAVKARMAEMGTERNGLGANVTKALYSWEKGIETIDKANLSIIENFCMSRISTSPQDFAFLDAERGKNGSLRKMFKDNAKQILKLKKCFILSPFSASVFFNKEEYADFDVVIVDEASQLEPTSILPVLFRAKQVVMVGDEWQMPPIKTFSSRSEKMVVNDDGEFELLNPDTSVLSLALENCAFPTEHFVCHYRSKTESLITFSQKKFYEHMRTFPAPVPKDEGLGFKDVLVENGRCKDGVNVIEAKQAIEELKLLFDKYYDEEKGVLKESVGIVAFGKKQLDYIVSLKDKDADLKEKIKTAIANSQETAEKVVFFKTIKTVQGQEIDHLIISLTYGRNEKGELHQSFAELNFGSGENKLGECIFNVAVTRAKSSVTMIHSVTAEEITQPSVLYLSEYLDTVRTFAKEGRTQFVGKTIDKQPLGFIRQVAEYIISLGIAPERIVIDFGVTEGSVKLPVVILSEDLKTAKLAIWCEKALQREYDYLDYNLRYVESLKSRGWNIVRLYAHDWVDNNVAEKQAIKSAIEKYVNN